MIPVLCLGQYTSIPDQNFEQALINFGYDDVIDGKLLTANINSVDSLFLEDKNISDLIGVEAFYTCQHQSLKLSLLPHLIKMRKKNLRNYKKLNIGNLHYY